MRIKQAIATVATAAGVSTAVQLVVIIALFLARAWSLNDLGWAPSILVTAITLATFAWMLMMCAVVMLPIFGWAGRPTVRTAVIAGLATGLPSAAYALLTICLGVDVYGMGYHGPTGLPGIIAAIAINEGAPVAGAAIALIVWLRMASEPVKAAVV